jgi:hypothetical protein
MSSPILSNPKLLRLVASFLDKSANEFDPHDPVVGACGFTEEEKAKLAMEFSQWNEDSDDPEDPTEFKRIRCNEWMRFLAAKLREAADHA